MAKNKKTGIPVITVIIAIILSLVYLVSNSHEPNDYSSTDNKKSEMASIGELTVHYLDVGQGDSEFIILPDGKTMLIDASFDEYGDDIVDSIHSFGYNSIDCVVATHPDADHIGGMPEVINSFEISDVYMPKVSKTTKTFEDLLETIADNDLEISTAKAGKTIYSNSEYNYSVNIIAPIGDYYDNVNDYSAVIKITFGAQSFLFMGDAEETSENEMLEADRSLLSADVLKVGHHGSSSSSTIDFLNAVNPDYAVISCGVDNNYGHPHKETLSKLSSLGVEVYRTDIDGTVTFTCDGKDIEVSTEK